MQDPGYRMHDPILCTVPTSPLLNQLKVRMCAGVKPTSRVKTARREAFVVGIGHSRRKLSLLRPVPRARVYRLSVSSSTVTPSEFNYSD